MISISLPSISRAALCALALFSLPVAKTATATESRLAPDFTLPTDGAELQLSSLRGQVVYLDFWASWCTPCRQSFPWMNAMQAKYAAQGFKVVSVNLDAEPELAAKFLRELPAGFAVAYDPKGQVAEQYRVIGMPSAYLIDREGVIRESHVGFREDSKPKYEDSIRKLLAM